MIEQLSSLTTQRHISFLAEQRNRHKAQELLRQHSLEVVAKNLSREPALLVSNHPTNWDVIFLRSILSHCYNIVNGDAVGKTGISELDFLIGLGITHMLPVYRQRDKEKNRRTFQYAAKLLDRGYSIWIAPSGNTAARTGYPSADELQLGGIISILKRAAIRRITPVVINIDGEIMPDATVKDGGNITLIFSDQPLDLGGIDFEAVRVDDILLKARIIASWEQMMVDK